VGRTSLTKTKERKQQTPPKTTQDPHQKKAKDQPTKKQRKKKNTKKKKNTHKPTKTTTLWVKYIRRCQQAEARKKNPGAIVTIWGEGTDGAKRAD